MEKDLKKGRFAIRKRDILLNLSLAAALSAGLKQAEVSGIEPSQHTSYPDEDFKPVVIYEDSIDRFKKLTPYSNIDELERNFERHAITIDTKEEKDVNELDQIISKMKSNNDLFNRKYIEDVEMYYPIYKAVADKYDLDWYLIWIVHEKETGASAGKAGFASDSYYVGAMQRDPNIWTEEFVDKASEGLEDLAKLPQRHKDDWKEIAAGAKILDRNFDKYNEDLSENKAVLKALLLYSAEEPARERFDIYKDYKEVFTS